MADLIYLGKTNDNVKVTYKGAGGNTSNGLLQIGTPAEVKVTYKPQAATGGAKAPSAGKPAQDLVKLDAGTERKEEKPRLWDRIKDTFTGAEKSYGSGMVDAQRALYEAGQGGRSTMNNEYLNDYQRNLDRAKLEYDVAVKENDKGGMAAAQNEIEYYQRLVDSMSKVVNENVQQKAAAAAGGLADDLQVSGQKDIEKAKEGLGKVGQTVVDAGVGAIQMANDIVAGAIVPGGSQMAMAQRTFGGTTQQARQEGADLDKQLLGGAAAAGVGMLTNKLFDGLAYGKGIISQSGVGQKLAASGIGQKLSRSTVGAAVNKAVATLGKTAAGRAALGRLKGAGGEAIEEMAETLLTPLVDSIYNGKTVGQNYDELKLEEVLHDGIVGGMIGLFGGGDYKNNDITPQLTDANGRTAAEIVAEQAQKNTATEAGSEYESAVKQLRNSIPEIAGMEHVATVDGTEVPKEGRMSERAVAFIKSIGNKVHRAGFGDVLFSNTKIKNSYVGHGGSEAKVELLAAVPGVIEKGKQVGFEENWKGRGYDTYMFAAPVNYKGNDVYVIALVNKDKQSNRYYLHEAVDQYGNVIYGQKESSGIASDRPNLSVTDTVADTELPNATIPQSADGVKNNRSTENGVDLSAYDLTTKEGARAAIEAGRAAQAAQQEAEFRGSNAPQSGSALEKLGVSVKGDQGDYSNVGQIRENERSKRAARRDVEKLEKKLHPTSKEKHFAHALANGSIGMEDVPATVDTYTVQQLAEAYGWQAATENKTLATQRARIADTNERAAAEFFEAVGDDFKTQPMLLMNERTPERIARSMFGQEKGEEFNEKYFYPTQQNEAEKNRFIRKQFDDVRTFADSQGKVSELTKAERQAVQQIMEDRYIAEEVAKMETRDNITAAAENIRKGTDPADAAKEFGLPAEERAMAERLARWHDNQQAMRDGTLDQTKVEAAVKAYSEKYDLFYDAINDFLVAHGFEPIGFIKGYAPHMQGADTQNRLMQAMQALGVKSDAMQLPTSITGKTADYKPGKRWVPYFHERIGDKTDYDVAKGFESYVSYVADVIYHTDDIARIRGAEKYLRKTYAPEELSHAIDHAQSLRNADQQTIEAALRDAGKIKGNTTLSYADTAEALEKYISELYDNVGHVTRYGEFAKYLDNYANILAGKQSMADRGMEYMAGRGSLNVGNKLVAAFGRAQVAGNISSAFNQTAQLAQITAEVPLKHVGSAIRDICKEAGSIKGLWNLKYTSEMFNTSDLLSSKKGTDYLTANDHWYEVVTDKLFKPADVMDGIVSAIAYKSKYNQLIADGEMPAVAELAADRWATSVMGSRAKGSRPMAFESKNVVNQMLHMFQVEALNSADHLASDLRGEAKRIGTQYGKKAQSRYVAAVVSKGILSSFLLNRAAEALYGGTPAPFDLGGYILKFVSSGLGVTSNELLRQMINKVWKSMFGQPLIGDDDDDKEMQKFDVKNAAAETWYDISNDLPLLNNAAALMGWGDQTMPLAGMADKGSNLVKSIINNGPISPETGSAALGALSQVAPGGRQLQKTVQGAETLIRGGRYYGYGDNEKLQYAVKPTAGNIVQALLFGNNGLSESRDFYAAGGKGLSKEQTAKVEELVKSKATDKETAYEAVLRMRNVSKSAEKAVALDTMNISDEEKLALYKGLVLDEDSKKPEQFEKMLRMGMTWGDISACYVQQMMLNENDSAKASEKATDFAVWLDGTDLTARQKEAAKDTFKFFSMVPADATRYENLTGRGIKVESAEKITDVIAALKPEGGKDSVSDAQKCRAIVNIAGITEDEKAKALETIYRDGALEDFQKARGAGIQSKQYVNLMEKISACEGVKDVNGKTISGTKKAAVLQAIDRSGLTQDQKDAMYYIMGYSGKTIYEAPWWNITPRL